MASQVPPPKDGVPTHAEGSARSKAPMSDYNVKALTALRAELETKIVMGTHLNDMLEKEAGGFMTTLEAQNVRSDGKNQMGQLIDILLGRGDEEFRIFCEMLRKSDHPRWAERMEQVLKEAGEAAVNAVRQLYDKLIQLPLDEKAPKLFSHYLISNSTLERVGLSNYIRTEKNGFILQDVIVAVQQKPELLDVFCSLLQDVHMAGELALHIKVLQRQLYHASASSEGIPTHPAKKGTVDEYMKMKMDLEVQDVKSMKGHRDPGRAIKLLYINALSRLIQLLEPHLTAVKDRANMYILLGLLEKVEDVKTCDIQSTESISELLGRMSISTKWNSTCFLQQAVDAIPAMAMEREIAEAILLHYSFHLEIYENAILLKDQFPRKTEVVAASKSLVPLEITSSKSFAKFTCEDCHRLQVRILSEAFGIPADAIICHDAVERKSTTVIFLVPNGFIYVIMEHTTRLETVWTLLELDVIEVAISGFTFKPTVGCFLALLRGSKPFTANLLGVTEILPFQMHCFIDPGSKESLSGRLLGNKRIAQHWRSHVLHTSPVLYVLEARVKRLEDQCAALKKQLKKAKDDALKEKRIKEGPMEIIQKSNCKKGIDTHMDILFRWLLLL